MQSSRIFTPDIKFLNAPSLTRPAKVCSLLCWFPLLVPFGPSARSRWNLFVVLTRACVQIVLAVHPAVRDRREVLSWRVHRSTVHPALQVSDVVSDVGHQQEQEIEGAWGALGVSNTAKSNYFTNL